MGLGAEIVTQLGAKAEHDLLASWMAAYLGEKISEVKRARGTQRAALEKECADLILKVWEHRHQLPDGTRPLESFEPLFNVLNELSQNKPRYSLLRNLPPTDKNSEVGKIVQGALEVDKSASALIRYVLAYAAEKIPKGEKRWAEIQAVTKSTPWDIEIVRFIVDDAEAIFDDQEKLEKHQIEKLNGMLKSLENFENATASLRTFLEVKIKASQ